jgi:hypothetical protein
MKWKIIAKASLGDKKPKLRGPIDKCLKNLALFERPTIASAKKVQNANSAKQVQKVKKDLERCKYCKTKVQNMHGHLQRCEVRKRLDRLRDLKRKQLKHLRIEAKMQAEIEHQKRLKTLDFGHTPTPSRASARIKHYSSWQRPIEGGSFESNRRRH